MKNYFASVFVIAAGLLTAQVCATLKVWDSNLALYTTLSSLNDAGYLTVPGAQIQEGLKGLRAAFCGGVFFTLSTGACLTLFTFFSLFITDLFKGNRKKSLAFISLSTLVILALINQNGLLPLIILEFTAVPAVTALLYVKLIKREEVDHNVGRRLNLFVKLLPYLKNRGLAPGRALGEPPEGRRRHSQSRRRVCFAVHAFFVLLLVGVLFVLVKMPGIDVFTGFRDNFLLTGGPGQVVNDYYYKYTLYPAQSFKSLRQKNLKTCSLETKGQNRPLATRIKRELAARDYLVVSGQTRVDLALVLQGNTLIFKNGRKTVITTPVSSFMASPRKSLREFSNRTDRYPFYRQFTFISLLTGLPLLFYLVMHSGASLLFFLFMRPQNALLAASLFCFASFMYASFLLAQSNLDSIDRDNLATALSSPKRQVRVAALIFINEKKLDINNFPTAAGMVDSPHVAERYWVARAAGLSSTPEEIVTKLMKDPHPNVVCQALLSLGKTGDKDATEKVTTLIRNSTHWYVQWYAYRALRRLGWIQKISA